MISPGWELVGEEKEGKRVGGECELLLLSLQNLEKKWDYELIILCVFLKCFSSNSKNNL
jgi:hypothetical protein